jgi:hypothetical protein
MPQYTDSTGLTWNYTESGGNATIGTGDAWASSATTLGTSLSGAITIPSTIPYGNGDASYNVTTIGNYAFYNCTSLTSITIPDSVTTIGRYAFYYCTNLTSIDLSGTQVETIDYGAFARCSNLTSITFPTNPLFTTIDTSAFEKCSKITSITIPDSVETIGTSAFNGCTGLTSVTLPTNSLFTTIGLRAFYNCNQLNSIIIPDSVTTIDSYAFYLCSSLTSITFPTNVNFTTINRTTFYYCTSLTSITIPDSVETIGENAFWKCTSLISITIPDSVTTIGPNAFSIIGSPSTVTVKDVDPNDNYTKTTLENNMTGKISGAVTYEQWVAPNYAPNTPTLSDISCNENTPYTATVSATDDNGDILTFSLSGPDFADFTLSGNAVLSAKAVFDFETKTTYNITITASDGSLNTSADFTITVNNVVETASELFNANVQGTELKTTADNAGITSQQLRDAGYTFEQLVAADICFVAGTPVNTDQGDVAIDKIDVSKHTIRGKRVVAVTKTVCTEKHLVCIRKDALAKNVPSQDTLTTKNHCFFYNGNMVKAKHLVNKLDNVDLVKYDGCTLYNVLQDKHEKMVVNNLISETLHPEHGIAQIYRYFAENNICHEIQQKVIASLCKDRITQSLTK